MLLLAIVICAIHSQGSASDYKPVDAGSSDVKVYTFGRERYVRVNDYNECVDELNSCIDRAIEITKNCDDALRAVDRKLSEAEKDFEHEKKDAMIKGAGVGSGATSIIFIVLILIFL